MNIAILIPALGGGGAERVAQMLGEYYTKQGETVYYFLLNTKIKEDYRITGKIVRTGIKSSVRNEKGDWETIANLTVAAFRIRRLKYLYKINVAVSFMEEANYLNVLSKGKEKVITRVCTILSQREELKGFLYKKEVVKFFYSHADAVIVMSQYAMRDMRCFYKIPQRKLIQIPNCAKDVPGKQHDGVWDYGEKTVICVGRLEQVKQHEKIIRAFSYVCQKERDAKLIILGKGPQLRYLKHICEIYQIKAHVIFLGFQDNVSYYLKRARAFVMASKAEGFPNSMVEAMFHGVPVITTDSPGACGEIIGKPGNIDRVGSMLLCKYGILVPDMPHERPKLDSELSKQEKILAEAMVRILADEELYERYRNQSLIRAEMFSMDKIIKKWDRIMGK